jgi:hypothetical protein
MFIRKSVSHVKNNGASLSIPNPKAVATDRRRYRQRERERERKVCPRQVLR